MPQTSRQSPQGKIQIGPKKKIALVCSGGATKAGAFHLGVALALKEQGFRFYGGLAPTSGPARPPGPMEISTYVGSSAGSMISSYLAAGYSLENIFNSFLGRAPTQPEDAKPRVLERLTYSKMFKIRPELAREQLGEIFQVKKLMKGVLAGDLDAFFQLRWLKATGLFSTSGLEQYLREEVLPSNRFQDYLADLFVVATQLNHSRKVVFGKYSYQPPPHDLTCQYNNDVPISQACAASTALPFVFAPYPITGADGKQIWYIDGELRDTLSSHVAIDAGADLVIASHTHQPYHFHRAIGSLTDHGLPAILIQSIYLIIEQKINHHIHNKQIQRNAINAVNRFCKDSGIDPEKRARIIEILENELHHRLDVDTIYIHPSPSDAKTFFAEHFSLSSQRLTEIVRSGFKATIDTLRKYEFADRTAPAQTIVDTESPTTASG